MSTEELIFDLVTADELVEAIAIEEEGYPADEAASLSSFQYRQSQAGELFLGVFLPDNTPAKSRRIIGYICSTLAKGDTLTHESMSNHTPGAASDARRTNKAVYERVLLIAHEPLIPLYQKAGFELVGKSSVHHGSLPWFEMVYPLSSD
ncbi:hypothetical protein VNI00_007735 [Paramarasmius palmivorus]|uniref:N-acetyltransferase domain-containing protein n=1 Tax=Paramarasmius palmivorus TaxID=297713 RepID=A0AAW0D2H0_9AGAR